MLVEVGEGDTDLLMLVRHHISGGEGGAPGTNGSGGSGGRGGSGGSSHSWTESESYTDAQGNRRTRTTSHSNPGGSNGRVGFSGRSADARVVAGKSAKQGSFTIGVDSESGRTTYPQRYHLQLLDFSHASDNRDGIYEPQETVRVFDLEVQNVGGMPTPPNHEIHLWLRQHGWVLPAEEKLVLPGSLAPGARLELSDEELHFEIGDYAPQGPDDPLEVPEVVRHAASVPSVQREFYRYAGADAEQQGRFTIRFPVEAAPLDSLRALALSEAAQLRWSVTNRSSEAFGVAGRLGRVLRFRLYANQSELDDRHAVLLDDADARVSLTEGWVRQI